MTTEIVEIIRYSEEDIKNILAVRNLLDELIEKSHDAGKREDARAAIKALTKIYGGC